MGSRLEEKSNRVRKRILSHNFDNEDGDEYEGSKFGGFSEYFRRKKIKLQNLDAERRSQSSDKPQIFRGVSCHVNGYTQPSLNDLHTLIVQHGGAFMQYLDGKTMVTHIIASNLTPKKKEEFRRYRIVKPAWIVDSIKAGKLLPWDVYRVVDEGIGQKVLGFENGNVVAQASTKSQGYREQTDTSWYTDQLRSPEIPSNKKPRLTQTVTPAAEAVEDDEYPLPEITSSIEQALNEASHLHLKDREPGDDSNESCDTPASKAELQTPPPSSPPNKSAELNNLSIGGDTAKPHSRNAEVQAETTRPYRPGKDFDLAGFSHALVENSDVFKNIPPQQLAEMTAEEHNALLLSDPNIRKSTVVHPDFLEQYYRESRLHHLSTWKADLKSQLQAIAAEKSASQRADSKRLPGQRRYIMHVDFDCFFAAVSLKRYPQYQDKPAVVAHGNGSGSEIASCNYPARKFGVNNGMWMKRALELCPEIKILPYDFPNYEAASRKFYDAIMATGGIVQSVSIDEALVDVSAMCFAEAGTDGIKRHEGGVDREQDKADRVAQQLRDEVYEKTGCAVSVGIGGNILQAKVALRKAKPAGQFQLKPGEVLDFIGQLEVTKLPGVAWSTGAKLEEIGIKLVKDIREASRERLINTLGPKTGEKLWDYARGIDKAEVGDQVVRKSVSAEVNWGVRFENQEQVDEFMQGLCGELSKRLLKEKVKGKQLTMKVMRRAADAPLDPPKHLGHGKCDVVNKSIRLGIATNEPAIMTKETIAMLKSFAISPGELRGIGVQMQQLEPIKQGADGVEQASQRKLQFGVPVQVPAAKSARAMRIDPIQDDLQTPDRQRAADANLPSAAFQPIEPDTPKKRLLNTLGTQFILPTQVDPSVLAELPDDIRARLAKHANKQAVEVERHETASTSDPALPLKAQSSHFALPQQSQIDPSILEALPDDVRKELLGFYRSPGKRSEKRSDQALLPQSPRKIRTLPSLRQPPPKRGRGRPRGSRNLASTIMRNSAHGEGSTLTQSNFVARTLRQDDAPGTDTETEVEEIDPDVLAALPPDLREEVLAQQRQLRLQRTGGIDLSLHQRSKAARKKKSADEAGPLDRHFILPPRTAKPTFTRKKLSDLADLRDAVSAWFEEFDDEGPYEEDIAALVKYLRDVVLEEGDLSKAVAVVKWLAWVIEDSEDLSEVVVHAWRRALGEIQHGVQTCAQDKGMGTVLFE